MARMVKTEWFGKQITVMMVNDKSLSGTLSEVTDNYIVIERDGTETQIMCHAIVAVRLAAEKEGERP